MKIEPRKFTKLIGLGLGASLLSATSLTSAVAAPLETSTTISTSENSSALAETLNQHGLLTPAVPEQTKTFAKSTTAAPLSAPPISAASPTVQEVSGLSVPTPEGVLSVTPAGELPGSLQDGWVFYDADDYAVAATTTSSGPVNALYAVIENSKAPSEYRFEVSVDGTPANLEAAGGMIAINNAAGVRVNTIAPAWALDSEGVYVPTHFEIDGSTLIQVVDHSQATYPVVADPSPVCDAWSCTLRFNKSETATAAESGFAATGILCGGAALINAPAGFACGVYGTVLSVTSIQAKNQGDCVAFRTSNYGLYTPHPLIYNDSYCR